MGWPPAMVEGARGLKPGQKCKGRAITLRMVPQRPDIAADKPAGEISPEYEAFELCGPKEVLCISSVGPWESVGGDIKFLRLKQLGLGGLVTDGSVRDTDEILSYGFPCFSHSTTAKQGPAAMQPLHSQPVELGQTNPVVLRLRSPLEDTLLTLDAGSTEPRLVEAIDALVAIRARGRPTTRTDAGASHGEDEPHAYDTRARRHVDRHGVHLRLR